MIVALELSIPRAPNIAEKKELVTRMMRKTIFNDYKLIHTE